MDRISRLDAVIRQFDLNQHPFYQDWRAGKLPQAKLSHYGEEYGQFIGTIDMGWDTVGRPDYADEERYHETLWADFRAELPQNANPAQIQTRVLVDTATALFSQKAEALGALYSFEAQQPNTSQSKLDGLKEHYTLTEKGLEYFRVHAGDVQEAEDIRTMVGGLSDGEFERALSACNMVCTAMWGALDGIYYQVDTSFRRPHAGGALPL